MRSVIGEKKFKGGEAFWQSPKGSEAGEEPSVLRIFLFFYKHKAFLGILKS